MRRKEKKKITDMPELLILFSLLEGNKVVISSKLY